MNVKELTNEELIQLFKENDCSMQGIEKKYSLGNNTMQRLFVKRGIDYNQIKKEYQQSLIDAYYKNPKLCKQCGKPISYEDRRKDFCDRSCSAKYNNCKRAKQHCLDPNEKYFCLNCGKELTYSYSSRMKFCDVSCQQEYRHKQYIDRWKKGEETGTVGKYDISNYIRRYLFEKYNCSCQKCGWNQVNPCTGNVPLQVHHIDGNCLNNKEEKLQLLCPNCHSLTDTFGNLNQKSSRIYRKQKENTQNKD